MIYGTNEGTDKGESKQARERERESGCMASVRVYYIRKPGIPVLQHVLFVGHGSVKPERNDAMAGKLLRDDCCIPAPRGEDHPLRAATLAPVFPEVLDPDRHPLHYITKLGEGQDAGLQVETRLYQGGEQVAHVGLACTKTGSTRLGTRCPCRTSTGRPELTELQC